MKHLLFALPFAVALICGCRTAEELLSLLKGPAAPHLPEKDRQNFAPYAGSVKPYGNMTLIKAPEADGSFVVEFAAVTPVPDSVYEFRMRYAGQENIQLHAYGIEESGNGSQSAGLLMRTMSYLNVNGMVEYAKPFAVSKDCRKLIPLLRLSMPGKFTRGRNCLLVEDMSIRRLGPMKHASAADRENNLASDYDFSKYPAGDFRKIYKGKGKTAPKWSDVKAQIVKENNTAWLRITRKPENYIYPFLELKPFPADPLHHSVRVSLKARGKGSFRIGLWWKRPSLGWDYENRSLCRLTDQWQTFTAVRPCMTPDVTAPTLSFTSYGDGEFDIKDISVTLE